MSRGRRNSLQVLIVAREEEEKIFSSRSRIFLKAFALHFRSFHSLSSSCFPRVQLSCSFFCLLPSIKQIRELSNQNGLFLFTFSPSLVSVPRPVCILLHCTRGAEYDYCVLWGLKEEKTRVILSIINSVCCIMSE